jgi:hypothetical protein
MQLWWNDTDGDNRSTQRKICLSANFFRYKFHIDGPEIEPNPLQQETVD